MSRPLVAPPTLTELLQSMDRAGVARGVVWHPALAGIYPGEANQLISRMVAGTPRLEATWGILPPVTGEVTAGNFFDAMRTANVRTLRALPADHRYLLRRGVFGKLLDQVSERRIPLLLSLQHGVTFDMLHDLMEEYPTLTAIICDVGIWGADRQVWPLLERYQHLHVETSLVSLEAGGLEAGVRRFGARRFIFGSKFPIRYLEAPLLDLEQSSLSEEEKDLIAAQNLEQLLQEVEL